MPPPLPTPELTLRQRFSALRNLPPFLRDIWATSRGMTLATLVLRLVRALLPVAMLYVGKLIIDEAVHVMALHPAHDLRAAWDSGVLNRLGELLLLELGIAVLSDLLGRLMSYVDGLLSELFTNRIGAKLMEHAATLDLEDFEDPDLQDKLQRARMQTMGRMNLMGQLFGQAQDAITVVSFAAGLVAYAPWLMLLLALALIPAFIGESHFNAIGYSLNTLWTPERRELEYLKQVGSSVETAKEVKIFDLNRFLIQRFRTLSAKFYAANKTIAAKRAIWGTLLAALGSLAYYTAYAYIAWRTVRGDFSIGDLTFLSSSFLHARESHV